MAEIEFIYNQQCTIIQANLDEPLKNIINKYLQKSLLNENSVFFIANGKPINSEMTVESHMNQLNKENKKLKILVQLDEDAKEEQIFAKSKDIICPKCYEPCMIKTENYKISLFGCIKNHTIISKIKDFPDTQKLNISDIICSRCKVKNKGNSQDNLFYKCLTCNQNLCLLCKNVHQLQHNIINYDDKNYVCEKHNEQYIKYCKKCNNNICFSCEDENEGHDIISLNEIKPNIDEIKNKLIEMKTEIDLFSENIKQIINKLNELSNNMNLYYEIYNDLLNNYEKKNRNYQILQNINQINNNDEIIQNIKSINNMNDITDKFNNIILLYKSINSDNIEVKESFKNEAKINNNKDIKHLSNKKNHITIIYDISKNKHKIKLFGGKFVKNNMKNCYLLIDGEKSDLHEYWLLKDSQKNKNTLEIELVETATISNMYCMFDNCGLLISLPDISEFNTENVINMGRMFYQCKSLLSLPDISKWKTDYVYEMSYMFAYCGLLESLPDISKWNTINVEDMSGLFYFCKSLKTLPDISKWKIIKVKFMRNMFNNCSSLKSLPDLSQWKIRETVDINCMFSNCKSLKAIPDISEWEIGKSIQKNLMFDGCNEEIIPQKFK